MATFERSVTTDWEGGLMDGKGVGEGGNRRVFAAGDVSEPHRRGRRQDEPRRADGGGARGVLCDGDERRARQTRRQSGEDARHGHRSADKSDAGIKIVSSKLKVVVEGLEGMTPGRFRDVREGSRQRAARCRTRIAARCRLKLKDRRRKHPEIRRAGLALQTRPGSTEKREYAETHSRDCRACCSGCVRKSERTTACTGWKHTGDRDARGWRRFAGRDAVHSWGGGALAGCARRIGVAHSRSRGATRSRDDGDGRAVGYRADSHARHLGDVGNREAGTDGSRNGGKAGDRRRHGRDSRRCAGDGNGRVGRAIGAREGACVGCAAVQ